MQLVVPQASSPLRLRFEQPLSDEELLRFCAKNDDLRIERDANGDLIVMSPTGSGTGSRNAELNFQLALWARQTNSGVVFDSSAGFTLPDGSMRSPDAAWISWPRWNALTEAQRQAFAPICPEFLVELRSPTDDLPKLQKKMQSWLANGAELAWLIDPERKIVEIYRPGKAAEEQEGHTAAYGEGPVGGFVLELGRIWG
ncbi:Endonuclease, Uma2 family (restriction endonuclease fold) [Bryocella elongata]|uniref:Endonuclease, Uma2 family (Restriction endonuclease fold) n=1 Tax=Bryocella elongata TaxID=863522 RepID=A0A1H6B0A8_9BACT|nr:Uma2 family endonuclease [Bryocella elongata]SEG54321.1 Endonuclease, Uma2 family (restriction endonuclease fold) [Bryocella elongata]